MSHLSPPRCPPPHFYRVWQEYVLPKCQSISGWMYDEELLWLYEQAQLADTIIEVGVWQGKSTLALAMGTPGIVYAIDHWHGSLEEQATHHAVMQTERGRRDVFVAAMQNLHPVIDSGNCIPLPMSSEQAALLLAPRLRELGGANMIFLDGGHDYKSLCQNITTFRELLAPGGLFCGHDYKPDLPGVIQGTKDLLGTVNVGPGSIWSIRL